MKEKIDLVKSLTEEVRKKTIDTIQELVSVMKPDNEVDGIKVFNLSCGINVLVAEPEVIQPEMATIYEVRVDETGHVEVMGDGEYVVGPWLLDSVRYGLDEIMHDLYYIFNNGVIL